MDARLQVTLVSGLRNVGKTALALALAPRSVSSAGARSSAGSDDMIDLAESLVALAEGGTGGHVVVELAPEADPMHAGLILESVFESLETESAPRLRNVVTVARVSDVTRLLFGGDGALPGEDYNIAEHLAVQLEFATTVVLSGIPEATVDEVRQTRALISRLNPWSNVISLETARRSPGRCVSNRTHPARGLAQNAGWMLELAGRAPEFLDPTLQVVVFRDPRPFHPERLAHALENGFDPARAGLLLRSRGLTTLATRPGTIGSWASAGEVLSLAPTSMTSWDPESPIGQEIVFFGRELHFDYLTTLLGSCVLTAEELLAGPTTWRTYADNFPEWEVSHGH
jgi:G3E family GTPase